MLNTLLVTLTLATGTIPLTHDVPVEGSPTPLTLRYEADVAIEHRQVGTVAPGGRPDTLRCHWTAGGDVRRTLIGTMPARPSGGCRSRRQVRWNR
jgi:hypothetical protein